MSRPPANGGVIEVDDENDMSLSYVHYYYFLPRRTRILLFPPLDNHNSSNHCILIVCCPREDTHRVSILGKAPLDRYPATQLLRH